MAYQVPYTSIGEDVYTPTPPPSPHYPPFAHTSLSTPSFHSLASSSAIDQRAWSCLPLAVSITERVSKRGTLCDGCTRPEELRDRCPHPTANTSDSCATVTCTRASATARKHRRVIKKSQILKSRITWRKTNKNKKKKLKRNQINRYVQQKKVSTASLFLACIRYVQK